MNDAAGLCGRCAHRHVIVNARGSRFYRCRRAEHDPRLVRYPRLPVTSCPGFEETAIALADSDGDRRTPAR